MGDRFNSNTERDGRSKSRCSSEVSEDSACLNYFDASMEGVSLETLASQRLRSSISEEAHDWQTAPHSSSFRKSGERREVENGRRSTLQRSNDDVVGNLGIVGSSFRSEDSEMLALWEEKSEGGLDRLGGRRGKAGSTDLGGQKPAGLQSPWRESVSNAVKKIESISHAVVNNKEKLRTSWGRSSPSHPKAVASLDSPRPLLDKKAGSRSPWRDFRMTDSSPMRTTESLLHNSPKARYSHGSSPCRRLDRSEFESSSSPMTTPKQLRQAVRCELRFDSSAAARPVDFNLRRKVDEREERSHRRGVKQGKGVKKNENELESSRVQPPMQPKQSSNCDEMFKVGGGLRACETTTIIALESSPRASPLSLSNLDDVDSAPRTIAAAAERALSRQSTKVSVEAAESALSRQSTKISLEAVSLSMGKCLAESMDEAVLNECASEAGPQQAGAGASQEAGERKASHRYYQSVVVSRGRSSRWSSSDGNHVDAIDFVAPSAARFLDDEGCLSPAMAPIKTEGAVPFKWENEPGKPKKDSERAAAQLQSALQLPPRLAVSQQKQGPWSQHTSSRNWSMNMAMSGPLAELHSLPTPQAPSSEAQKVQLLSARTTLESTTQDSCSASSERGPGSDLAAESPMAKSQSVREVRPALRNLSRLAVSDGDTVGDAELQGMSPRQCTTNAPPAGQPNHQKPALLSGNVRPTSPTSILCGPDDGSRPSSNPSLSSEREAPLISARVASSLSHCSSHFRASFDSCEHSIGQDSGIMSPESNLTSPLRANTRCNSMSYHDSDPARKLRTDLHEGSGHSLNVFVKFCKSGKRWMRSKPLSKLGTIHSPEVWTPGLEIQYQRNEIRDSVAEPGNSCTTPRKSTLSSPSTEQQRATSMSSDFFARLGGQPSPSRLISKIDHNDVQTDCRLAPSPSAQAYEDLGNRSPAYAATLELFSPLQEFSSKKQKKLHTKPPARTTRKAIRCMRVRVRARARFLFPIRRALSKIFSSGIFRRRTRKVKATQSKLLYHVDYTLSPADFKFCKPN